MKTESRISLGITLVTAVALASALSLIHVLLNRFQEHHFDEALLHIARQEAREASSNRFSFTTRPGPAANDVGPLDKYGVIYDAAGKVVAATPPFDQAPPPLRSFKYKRGVAFDLSFKGSALRGVLVATPGPDPHTVLLAASRDDLDGDDNFLKRAMVLAFLASLLSSFLVAVWLTKRFTSEHRRLATTLHRVAQGDVLARAPEGSSDPDLLQWGRDLNDVAQQLSELIRSQQQFIANAAHELRSPIATLYGRLQLSLRKERSAEGYQSAITNALLATRRLKRLTDDLLTLARTEHEHDGFEPVRLQSMFDDLKRDLASDLSDKQLHLEAELAELSVYGRAADLQRLLRNLLDNAIRHSPVGGVIRCEAKRDHAQVVLSVRDDGPGVAQEDRARIFDPFFRSPQTRGTSTDGSGLGLSIARAIARAHGGDLRIQDSAKGAEFVAELPAASVELRRRPSAPVRVS